MTFSVSEMTIEDYDDVFALWKSSEAIVLNKVDSRDCISKLLQRNPGLSFTARADGECVGAVLCSHDGRLGYLSHLVVKKECRKTGIGRQLVGRCMYALTGAGIHHCMLITLKETPEALAFWHKIDPGGRVDLVMMGPRQEI